eukprot:5892767-Amphidinium_carterae.1
MVIPHRTETYAQSTPAERAMTVEAIKHRNLLVPQLMDSMRLLNLFGRRAWMSGVCGKSILIAKSTLLSWCRLPFDSGDPWTETHVKAQPG